MNALYMILTGLMQNIKIYTKSYQLIGNNASFVFLRDKWEIMLLLFFEREMGNTINVEPACISSIFHEKGEMLKILFAARVAQLMWFNFVLLWVWSIVLKNVFFFFLIKKKKEKTFYTYSLRKRLLTKDLTNKAKNSKVNHSQSYKITDVKDTNITYNLTIKTS
jgi:hypothetical protein